VSSVPRLERFSGPAGCDHLIRSLSLVIFLQWLGASAILPLLPLYLRNQGGSDQMVGAVMAAYFVAAVVFQYPAGQLADRIGRRPVLLGGLVTYAGASLAFVLDLGPPADILLRGLQGCGAGAVEVAALAMVASSVPLERRGRAFGSIYRGQLGGMAIGPLVGSLIGVGSMNLIFVGAAVTSLIASLTVTRGAALEAHDGQPGTPPGRSGRGLPRLGRAAIGSLIAGVALGLTVGVYETCWTLLLHQRGATTWQVGLSWTLFAVPFALMARPGGWIADHLDRRMLVVVTVLSTLGFCAIYPFLTGVAWLLGLGAAEAVGVAIALPSIQSLLTQDTEPDALGRVQGAFATAETAAIAVAAAASGALFAVVSWAPFVAAAALGATLVAILPIVWGTVSGRVSEAGGVDVPPLPSAVPLP
jgi:DHA1 family multidrug resistance protein-like MFS transporter